MAGYPTPVPSHFLNIVQQAGQKQLGETPQPLVEIQTRF
jgi:hypothetical protein